jgi:hypothetical protein
VLERLASHPVGIGSRFLWWTGAASGRVIAAA